MSDTKSYSFSEALMPPQHDISGVVLKPFALGHWIYLEEYSSPLLSAELYPEPVSNDESENMNHCYRHILLFILVCAHSYEDNQRLYNDADFFNETVKIYEEKVIQYINKTEYWNIWKEIRTVKEYLNYYINSMPDFVESGPPSAPSGLDWKQNVYSVLKNEYGYSQTEIMNMSMRRINSEWVTFAAKNGAIKVKSKQQIDAEKKATELVAAIRAGKIKLDENGRIIPCQ